MEKFTVTINYHGHYGTLTYDPETKEPIIDLGLPEQEAKVNEYLHTRHQFEIPAGDNIHDFKPVDLYPLDDEMSFKLCLTRMWVATDVRVEWSMPPGMVESLV